MGLYASFRAAHCLCCFGGVHPFPITQQEGFPLTRGKPVELMFNQADDLFLLQCGRRGIWRALVFIILQYLKGIERVLFMSGCEGGDQFDPCVPDGFSAVMVADGVLQYALEQRRQFSCRFTAILFGKLDHRILHDIQSLVRIVNRIERLFVCAAIHAAEELC